VKNLNREQSFGGINDNDQYKNNESDKYITNEKKLNFYSLNS
jgi:hypothetical protein